MSSAPSKGRTGRPRAADQDTVAEIAFRLFLRDGFASTTMEDIARAVGISRPTLFRYFPSKSDIVWEYSELSAERLRHFLAVGRRTDSIVDDVFGAYLQMLTEDEHRLAIVKSRIALVITQAETLVGVWERFVEWGDLISGYLAERLDVPADSATARVLGHSIWAGLWAAVSSWAVSDEARPERILAEARSALTGPLAPPPGDASRT